MSLAEKRAEYEEIAHALQTAAKHEGNLGATDQQAWSLRAGLNNAMADHAALAELLIEKGILTREEYFDQIIKWSKRELAAFEDRHGIKFY